MLPRLILVLIFIGDIVRVGPNEASCSEITIFGTILVSH